MSSDREKIDAFGPLWSGPDVLEIDGSKRTLQTVQRAFDLVAEEVVAIDLVDLSGGRYAFRFYDGEDRRVVAFVFDADYNVLEELRAPVADWIGDEEYEKSGMEAFFAGNIALKLFRKVQGGAA